MERNDVRTLLRWGLASVVLTGAVCVASAASLNGLDSDSVAAWAYPVEIESFDVSPPTIDAVLDPAPNAVGWHNTPVNVQFICTDAESGISSCTDAVTVSTEGANQVLIGTATDHAGNSTSTSVRVDIDLTAPTVVVNGVLPGAIVSILPPVSCTATDTLSGVAGPCVVTFEPAGGINFDAVATARDFADNVTVKRVRFSIP